MTNLVQMPYKRPYPHTNDRNVIEAYLREGNEDERVQALCDLPHAPENYDLFWEIFLSDENTTVKHNALHAALYTRPNKTWYILNYLIRTNTRITSYHRPDYNLNDPYIVTVATCLNSLHTKKRLSDTYQKK